MTPPTLTNRIEAYLDRLFGYAYSLCNDRDAAKDLVQDCAVRALGAKRVPEDDAAYRAWLFRILRNLFLDNCRRDGRTDRWFRDETVRASAMEYLDVDERLVDVITVRLEFGKLPPIHREILGLVDIAGFSYAEAASHLDLPVGTVMSRVSRARRTLLETIAESDVRPITAFKKRHAREQ